MRCSSHALEERGTAPPPPNDVDSRASTNQSGARCCQPTASVVSSTAHQPVAVGNDDSRRFLANASARSQRLVETLLSRLRTYKTFQPVVPANPLYKANSTEFAPGKRNNGELSVNTCTSASRHLSSLAGGDHMARACWEVIDEALDNASMSLLKHNGNDHFATTISRGIQSSTKAGKLTSPDDAHVSTKRTRKNVLDLSKEPLAAAGSSSAAAAPAYGARGDGAATAASLVHRPSALPWVSTMSADTDEIRKDAWIRDHPGATAQDIQAQTDMWRQGQLEAERKSRQRHLAQLKDELSLLMAPSRVPPPRGPQDLSYSSNACAPSTLAVAHGDVPSEDGSAAAERADARLFAARAAAAREDGTREQCLLWDKFARTECLLRQDRGSGGANVANSRIGPAERIIYEYDQDASVHEWVEREWHTHTHRHEDAALLIQRAFRAYLAKQLADRLRSARIRVFMDAMRAEEVAQQQWRMAVRISGTQAGTAAEAAHSLRALQFFSNRVVAVAEVRRARKRKALDEEQALRTYAATAIQRVYRGYRARQFVLYVRNPELWEARQLEKRTCAALTIQKTWRRVETQRMMQRRRDAAGAIQRCFRSHVARVRARSLRFSHMKGITGEVRSYAAEVIGRFCLRYVRRRSARRGVSETPRAPTPTDNSERVAEGVPGSLASSSSSIETKPPLALCS